MQKIWAKLAKKIELSVSLQHKTLFLNQNDMKKLKFAIILLALMTTVQVSAKKKFPVIQFEQTVIDFGTFSQDTPIQKCTFKFKNVGDAKLVINYVHPSCGCTVADFPKDFISPGGTGEITVTYDATNKMPGKFRKSIQIYTNCEEEYMRIYIQGNMTALVKETKEE